MRTHLSKRSIEKRAVLVATLVLLVLPSFTQAIRPHQMQTLSPFQEDLNAMMLEAWRNWDSLLTRWFSINGTLVDPYDFSRRDHGDPSNTTASGVGPYMLALMNMYEETGDHYYLSKLHAIVEGAITDPTNYRLVPGFGQIFYIPTYYFDSAEHDSSLINTMLTAVAAIRLWKWTENQEFRQLAERVAGETLSLAAINNATDLAWSQGYYSGRNEANAKLSVFRQAPATFFYTLYGKEIDPDYLDYVPRTLHWQFRAQLDSGGLTYHIGDSTEHKAYTGVQIFFFTSSYRILPDPFYNYTANIAKALSWLQSLPIDFDYMENYAVTSALINAWKANYTVDTTKTKTAAYLALKSLNFTTYGAFTKATAAAYGWRWPQLGIGCFLSGYPLPDGQFETSQISPLIDYSPYSDTDRNFEYGWRTNQGFDRFRANSSYGSGIFHYSQTGGKTLYFFFNRDQAVSQSFIEHKMFYLNLKHEYLFSTVEQQIYASGLVVSNVLGSASFSIHQESQDKIDIILPNGTTLVLNELCNSTINLGNKFMIRHQANPQHLFFIMSQNSIWTAHNQTYLEEGLLQLSTTISDGRLLLARISVSMSVLDVGNLFDIYASYFDQASPLTFTQMVDSYLRLKNQVGEKKYGLPNWKTTYENAIQEEVKLIAHSFPESSNITSLSFSDSHLTTNVSGFLGLSSNLGVYSGFRFSPVRVLIEDLEQEWGTDWMFDSTTRILMINFTFTSSPLRIDVFFVEDTTPPTLLSVERAIQNPEYNDTVTITANISDDESGVGSVFLGYSNGTYWSNTTMTPNHYMGLYVGWIPPHRYATIVQYRIFAADRAGNWISSEIYSYVVMDSYLPVIKFAEPVQGDYVGGNATITIDCQEANLDWIHLYIDGALVKTWDKNGTRKHIWDTANFADGSLHTLKLTAKDLAGNYADTIANVMTDNTLPSIEDPKWNPRDPSPSEKVTITVLVTDKTSGIDHVNIWYRRNETQSFSNQSMMFEEGAWIFVVESPPYETNVEFFIEAFDKAQNRASSQTYRYYVGRFPLQIFLFGILVAISVASVGVFLYHRWRQKRRKESTNKSPRKQPDRKN